MTFTNKQLIKCPKCKKHTRIIKAGLTQAYTPKQRYFCYSCRKQFLGPHNPHDNHTMNKSGIIPEEDELD
jgi:transposase-like protein